MKKAIKKELIYQDENQTKWLLDNGLTQVTYCKTKDSEPITMTYASIGILMN